MPGDKEKKKMVSRKTTIMPQKSFEGTKKKKETE